VSSRDGSDETEPEAVSWGTATPLETNKPVEHCLSIRFWNTMAPIGHLKRGPAVTP